MNINNKMKGKFMFVYVYFFLVSLIMHQAVVMFFKCTFLDIGISTDFCLYYKNNKKGWSDIWN